MLKNDRLSLIISLFLYFLIFLWPRTIIEAKSIDYDKYDFIVKRTSSSSSSSLSSSSIPQSVDDATMAKALSFHPRTDLEMDQFRILTRLLKLLIDRRTRHLIRFSLISEERAARVKNELARLRRYRSSLEQVMEKFGLTALETVESNRGIDSTINSDNAQGGAGGDEGVSKTVVNGINQPVWLLEQLRKIEQQQRRRSRSDQILQNEID